MCRRGRARASQSPARRPRSRPCRPLRAHLPGAGGRKLRVGCRRGLRVAAGIARVRGLRGVEPPPLPSSFVSAAVVAAAAPAGGEPHAVRGEGGGQRQAGVADRRGGGGGRRRGGGAHSLASAPAPTPAPPSSPHPPSPSRLRLTLLRHAYSCEKERIEESGGQESGRAPALGFVRPTRALGAWCRCARSPALRRVEVTSWVEGRRRRRRRGRAGGGGGRWGPRVGFPPRKGGSCWALPCYLLAPRD